MEDLISILMPFKNTALFLTECLESIQAQSIENWEVLAVDDHSSDSSRQILERFSNIDPRITVLDNKGKGIIPALRTAYAASSGRYITRMDSDDIMSPDKLGAMLGALKTHGPGYLATGQVKYFSETGISDGYARYERWLNRLTTSGTNYSEIYKECVIPSPCWMIGRADFEKCGGFNPDRYPEDYDLTFRFYQHQMQVIPSDKILHYWRDYPERTSRTSEHYALNYFLDIKIHYFLKLDRDKDRPLVVWGAGGKGKTIAKTLVSESHVFIWLCDNPRKIGRKIYGIKLHPYQILSGLENPQSIVTVANEEAQGEIREFFAQHSMVPQSDYFFFC